jgi:hypothetical protein
MALLYSSLKWASLCFLFLLHVSLADCSFPPSALFFSIFSLSALLSVSLLLLSTCFSSFTLFMCPSFFLQYILYIYFRFLFSLPLISLFLLWVHYLLILLHSFLDTPLFHLYCCLSLLLSFLCLSLCLSNFSVSLHSIYLCICLCVLFLPLFLNFIFLNFSFFSCLSVVPFSVSLFVCTIYVQ